jgi:hypothetical protein
MLAEARERLPLADLCEGGIAYMSASCGGCELGEGGEEGRPVGARVLVTEWDALLRAPALAAGRTHFVVVDPPYRPEHVALVDRAGVEGMDVHLYYGHDERQRTARLLRYLVHPRFAMVCTYRGLEVLRPQQGESPGADGRDAPELPARRAEVLSRAAELAWCEAQVTLADAQLERAFGILDQLGLDQMAAGEAKLEARNIPAYAEAEADFEECARLCLNL